MRLSDQHLIAVIANGSSFTSTDFRANVSYANSSKLYTKEESLFKGGLWCVHIWTKEVYQISTLMQLVALKYCLKKNTITNFRTLSKAVLFL